MNIKYNFNFSYLVIVIIFSIALIIVVYINNNQPLSKPIRVGILHSLSGTMANSEKPLVEILQTEIDKVNNTGGLLGRRIESVISDGRSDPKHFAKEADRLITKEKVDVIFGCWTSICRKAVKPVVEKYNHLLFYPVQYEGLEQSPNIIYTGSVPNQQIIPGLIWAINNFGSRVYLLGSDYIFPRAANFIMRDIANIKNAEVVAERYKPLASDNFDEIIAEIKKLKPDVILNTINGDSNKYFFSERKKEMIDNIPVVSFSINESEIKYIDEAKSETHYAVWSYFQTINSQLNIDFISRYHEKWGVSKVISDPMVTSYIGFKLWVQAVRSVESTNQQLIHNVLRESSINSPLGLISVDSRNHHLQKKVRIGQSQKSGQFKIIWESKKALIPAPYPSYRSRSDWNKIVHALSVKGSD